MAFYIPGSNSACVPLPFMIFFVMKLLHPFPLFLFICADNFKTCSLFLQVKFSLELKFDICTIVISAVEICNTYNS